MEMDNYEQNLDVMAEPASPTERRDANFIEFSDYIALYLAEVLDEYGHYEADDDRTESIAKGYAEYLRDSVRSADGRTCHVKAYFHDSEGVEVLLDALDHFPTCGRADVYPHIIDSQYEYVVERALDWGYSITLGDDLSTESLDSGANSSDDESDTIEEALDNLGYGGDA